MNGCKASQEESTPAAYISVSQTRHPASICAFQQSEACEELTRHPTLIWNHRRRCLEVSQEPLELSAHFSSERYGVRAGVSPYRAAKIGEGATGTVMPASEMSSSPGDAGADRAHPCRMNLSSYKRMRLRAGGSFPERLTRWWRRSRAGAWTARKLSRGIVEYIQTRSRDQSLRAGISPDGRPKGRISRIRKMIRRRSV